MTITGAQMKEARDRLERTQDELAEEVA